MPQKQQVDWFAQNAPKPAAAGGDWFSENAPQAQADAEKPSSAVSRFGSGVVAGFKAMIPSAPDTATIALSGAGPLPSIVRSAYQGYKKARSENQPIFSSVASGLGGVLGLDAPGIRERAAKGDVAGIIGEAVPSIAATIIGGEAPRTIRAYKGADIKGAVGRLARIEPTVENTPPMTGNLDKPKTVSTLRPLIKAVSSIGKLVGGPEFLNAVLPEHPTKIGPFKRIASGPVTKINKITGLPGESGALPTVNVIPEPRVQIASDRPGSQWSIKRKTGLLPAAKRGVPGAGDVLSNLSTVLYEPREGVGYGGPRKLSELMNPESIKSEVSSNLRKMMAPIKVEVDSSGIKYATDSNGVRVSIPKSIADVDVMTYARKKILEQAQMQMDIKNKLGLPTEEEMADARGRYRRHLDRGPEGRYR